jgi:hypothetical protein
MVFYLGLPLALVVLLYFGRTLFVVYHIGVDTYHKLYFTSQFFPRMKSATYRFFIIWLIAQWICVVIAGFYLVVYGGVWVHVSFGK